METLDKTELKELINCPICNSNSKIIDTVKTINIHSEDRFNLRECFFCKHWWIDPMPGQKYLIELYKEGSEFVVSPGYKGAEEADMVELEKYITELLEYNHLKINELNYLEIGVGPGYFFNYFYKHAKNAYGIEPGSWKPSNPNIVRDLHSIPKDLKFDLIFIQHVLEHIENPLETLSELSSFANDKCMINCNFPNKDCLYALLAKGKWRMVRPIGHINYFSRKSVNELFRRTGWRIIKKYSYRSESHIADSLIKFDWKIKHPLKLTYRILKDLMFKEILFEKDQWHVIGLLDSF